MENINGIPIELLQEWNECSFQLANIKEREMNLRKQIASYVIPEPEKPEAGTFTKELANGFKIKAKQVVNYSVTTDKDAFAEFNEQISKLCFEYSIEGEIFRFKPELNLTLYKNLPTPIRDLVNNIVTCKIGSPQLELVEPKKKA